jgi:hypothetical protein
LGGHGSCKPFDIRFANSGRSLERAFDENVRTGCVSQERLCVDIVTLYERSLPNSFNDIERIES